MKYDGVAAALVTCQYMDYDDKTDIVLVRFFVPSALLSSPEGLARMFTALRERFLPGPGDSRYRELAWHSWRIISIAEVDTVYLMPGLGDGGQSPSDPLDNPGAAV